MSSAGDALDGADACLVMTEWPEFTELDIEFSRMKAQIIIDGRHILRIPHAEGLCW
jgi:UDPglucose 6-dehydrogenase